MSRLFLLTFVLSACAKDDEGLHRIEGSVTVASLGHQATILWDTAVAYAESGTLIAYFTGAPGASCASIAQFLGPNDGPVSKEQVLMGGSCTLMVKIEDWDGSSSERWSVDETDGFNPGTSSVLRCDFGEGEQWELETRGGQYEDYYWSGDTFMGSPETFSWDIAGDEGGIDAQLDFSQFRGNLPYVTSSERYTASADIGGTMTASWCDELANATVL